jgi:hypothetical protein
MAEARAIEVRAEMGAKVSEMAADDRAMAKVAAESRRGGGSERRSAESGGGGESEGDVAEHGGFSFACQDGFSVHPARWFPMPLAGFTIFAVTNLTITLKILNDYRNAMNSYSPFLVRRGQFQQIHRIM